MVRMELVRFLHRMMNEGGRLKGILSYPGDDFSEFGRQRQDLAHALGQVGLTGTVPGVTTAVLVLNRGQT